MELLRKTEKKPTNSVLNKFRYYGIFLCPRCGMEIEKEVSHGKRDPHCGCGRKGINSTHGFTRPGSKLFRVYCLWLGMKKRCYSESHHKYHRYGARGIYVCQEWLENPTVFVDWAMSHGWQPGLQIDRRDNDGPYSPENCHFCTRVANGRNKSCTKLTIEKAEHLRSLYSGGGHTHQSLATLFCVSKAVAGKIIRNQLWVKEESK